jgi:hypothetical protein
MKRPPKSGELIHLTENRGHRAEFVIAEENYDPERSSPPSR